MAREDSLLADTGSGHGASRHFCPALVEYLLGSIMPLAPMRSQLISAEVTTNAAVESHMRVVKKQLLKGRTRLPPGDFVRLLLQDTGAPVTADLIPSRPLPRGRKLTTPRPCYTQSSNRSCGRNATSHKHQTGTIVPSQPSADTGSSSLCRLRRVSVVIVASSGTGARGGAVCAGAGSGAACATVCAVWAESGGDIVAQGISACLPRRHPGFDSRHGWWGCL